jgi:phenylpyruvate tautomerase PptA (4-oxalocrotonate tautomerase family)
MPFINVKTSVKASEEIKTSIENKLTESISLLPGKTSNYFMCAVEDNISFMFHGDKENTAFVEVKIFGKSTREAYETLTSRICDILEEELAVSPDYCYVKFEEVENWGFNRFMF